MIVYVDGDSILKPIKKAIDLFNQKLQGTYKGDPKRIIRDTRSAERVTSDHTGRWFYELFQNCDDAESKEVKVLLTDKSVYILDKGVGLQPDAIESLCGTDYSIKKSGTIGRKGLGFKAVYEISNNPQIFSIGGEGVEFSFEKAKQWLQNNGFPDDDVPYQWIPFSISWDDISLNDQYLTSQSDWSTVVKLNYLEEIDNEVLFDKISLKNYTLLTFHHIRMLEIIDAVGSSKTLRKITIDKENVINDTIDGVEDVTKWKIKRKTMSGDMIPPYFLSNLDKEDNARIIEDGINFLVGTYVIDGKIRSMTDYPKIHVYYPTKHYSPVPILLHADFFVKSDRTEILPIENNNLNKWIMDNLVHTLVEFVDEQYLKGDPANNITLLSPFEERNSHEITKLFWDVIVDYSKNTLKFGNINGEKLLNFSDIKLISTTCDLTNARKILNTSNISDNLLHFSYEENEVSYNVLKSMNCSLIDDNTLLSVINEESSKNTGNIDWIWTCWKWLSNWANHDSDEINEEEKIEIIKSLPILPVGNHLISIANSKGQIITWKSDQDKKNLVPKWMPIVFVDEWFGDKLLENHHSVNKILATLGVERIENVTEKALIKAIENYWDSRNKNQKDNPSIYYRYIYKNKWLMKEENAPVGIRNCPIPSRRKGKKDVIWIKAKFGYMGKEWGNSDLNSLFRNHYDIQWVQKENNSLEKIIDQDILRWLGCKTFPRLISTEEIPIHVNEDYNNVEKISYNKRFDKINLDELPEKSKISLLKLIANNWEYYEEYMNIRVHYRPYNRALYYGNSDASWWFDLKTKFIPPLTHYLDPKPLEECWILNEKDNFEIGYLLPVINLNLFESSKDNIFHWLKNKVKIIRTNIDELKPEEWKEILSNLLIKFISDEDINDNRELRFKIMKIYERCLDTTNSLMVALPELLLHDCPLLCERSNIFQIISSKEIFINDDVEIKNAFNNDVYFFNISRRYHQFVSKYFGKRQISDKNILKEEIIETNDDEKQLKPELAKNLIDSLSYIYVIRSDKLSDHQKLIQRIKNIKVKVKKEIRKKLILLDKYETEISGDFYIVGSTIFISEDKQSVTTISRSISFYLGVPGEADTYENLLRCNNDYERREKLTSSGISDEQIDISFLEFNNDYVKHKDSDQQKSTPPSKKPFPGMLPKKPKQPTKSEEDNKEKLLDEQNREERTPDSEEDEGIQLKDDDSEYEVNTEERVDEETKGSSGGGGGGKSGNRTSYEDNEMIETKGRSFAQRELELKGFEVEQMPKQNPGYDIIAIRDREQIKIEVKAHLGSSKIVNITSREYVEFLLSQEEGGDRWELWNVENLSDKVDDKVIITRYDDIPEENIEGRSFSLNLRTIKPIKEED
ncbi:MAG: ATP-binding protein [Candidatus Thermoplasmatota archaeon]|nr:ATP-binding protein [Candidatus Thermoplasmatota archaeon]